MIVFLDSEKQTITICDKVVQTLPWSQLSTINSILSGREVFYVESATVADGDEIVTLLSSVLGESPELYEIEDDALWVHATKGQLMLPVGQNEDGETETVTFYHNKFYSFEDLEAEGVAEMGLFQKAVKVGKLAIVNSEQKEYIMNAMPSGPTAKEKAVNSLIVDMDKSGGFAPGQASELMTKKSMMSKVNPHTQGVSIDDIDDGAITFEVSQNDSADQDVMNNIKQLGFDLDGVGDFDGLEVE